MTGDGRRTKRVAELLRAHLCDAMRREIDDPRLAGVVLTSVAVSDDLTVAKIGVRLLAGEDGQSQRRALLKNLKRSAGRLCRAIAPRLDLKRAPELWFSYDDGPDKQRRIEELLSEIELERKGEP